MRSFVALIYVLSLACLALGMVPVSGGVKGMMRSTGKRLPFQQAFRPGRVIYIPPKYFGSTVKPGNEKPHPVTVLSKDRKAASVVQFTHSPIKGQDVIRTDQIAGWLDIPKNGKNSYMDLNEKKVEFKNLPKNQKYHHRGDLTQHQLEKTLAAVAKHAGRGTPKQATALGKASSKTSGKKAAIVGGKKAAVRQAAKKAALKKAAGSAAKNGATAARQKAAVKLAKKKNPGSGHHT